MDDEEPSAAPASRIKFAPLPRDKEPGCSAFICCQAWQVASVFCALRFSWFLARRRKRQKIANQRQEFFAVSAAGHQSSSKFAKRSSQMFSGSKGQSKRQR